MSNSKLDDPSGWVKGWRATEMKKEAISFSILTLAVITAMMTTAVFISQIVPAAAASTQQEASPFESLE